MTDSIRPDMHLRTLLERTSEGHLLVSGTGLVEYANVAARVILACEELEPFGDPVVKFAPELVLRADHPISEVETTMLSAKQDRFPAEVSIVAVDEAAGRFWFSFRDISRRRGYEGSVRAHAAELERSIQVRTSELKQLRERHLRLYDHAPILDLEIDSEGSIASANRKACLSLGVPVERLVGVPLVEFALADRREPLAKALAKWREGAPGPHETRLRGADGSLLDVQLHPTQEGGAGRGSMRLLGLDVTARREAERLVDQSLELAESQRARMERILRGIGEGVIVTDPDGQVRLMNRIAERFLDVDEPFAFGRDLFSEQRDLDFTTEWREFVEGTNDIRVTELRIGGAGDRVFTVTMSRIRTSEGRPAGCVAVLRDVTRERQVERMKRDFVSNITHELRTPLASIRGFTTTILRGENVEEGDRVRFLQIVEKEAERLQRLIEDLLTLSRLEDGRESLNLRPADLVDVLEEARLALAAPAEQRGIELALATRGVNGAGVFDPDKIRRVIDNIVGNAMKYTPAGGRIFIELARRDDHLEVAVTDTGRGIDAELLDKIFDRFYTTNPAQGNPHGTGLGLHIVKRLLALHGGDVEAESRPGHGSTFRFRFPAIPRAAVEPGERTAEIAPAEEPSPEPPAEVSSEEKLITVTVPAPPPEAVGAETGVAEGGPGPPASGDDSSGSAGRRSGQDFRIPFPTRPGAPSLEEALTDDEDGPDDEGLIR